MMRIRTGGVAALTILALGVSLTACSAGSSEGTDSGDPPTGLTLTLWHPAFDSPELLDLYHAWEEESGNKLDIFDVPPPELMNVIQTKWAAGEKPDILGWLGDPAPMLALNPLQNLQDLSDMTFVKTADAVALNGGTFDDKVYSAQLGPLAVTGVYYNKKVFADAGLEAPQSYDDLASICSTLLGSTPGVTPIYEAGTTGAVMNLASSNYIAESNVDSAFSDAIADGSEKINDPDGPIVKGFEAYAGLRDQGCFNDDATTGTEEAQAKGLMDGSVAMFASDTNAVSRLDALADAATVDATVGFVAVSATSPVANSHGNPSGTLYLPKTGDSAKEAAARDFINFVTGPAYQDYLDAAKIIPTFSGVTTPELQGLMQDIDKASTDGTATYWVGLPGFGGGLSGEVQKLLAGQSTPQQAADSVQTLYEQAKAAIGE